MIVKHARPSMLGISLGSSNMALAVFEGNDARIIHNQEGSSTTPVVIEFFSGHQVEVGEESKKSLYVGQTNCIANFQWRLGTDWTYSINDVDVTAGQLTAYALKKLSDDARAVVGTLGPVILTIPAEFSDVGREATIDAARDAGLDIAQLIDEPVAAVEFFTKGSNQTEDLVGEVVNDKGNDSSGRSYAIVDVGAQYLDISIIEEEDKELRLLKSIRSELVSGAIFDQILIRIVAERFREKTGLALDAASFSPIDAENTKISLSKRRNTSVVVASFDYELSRDLKDKIGVQKDWSLDQIEAHIRSEFHTWNARLNELPEGPRRSAAQQKLNNLGTARWMLNAQAQYEKRSIEITRSDFETGISPALSQIKGCCDQLLADVHIQSDELSEVFLIGGSSRIPAVSDAVQKAFDRTPVWNPRADEIVAMGAAVYGARIGLQSPQTETVSPEVEEPKLREEPLSVENDSETATTVVDPLDDVRPIDVEVTKEPSGVRTVDLPQSPAPKSGSSRAQGEQPLPPQSTSERSVAQLIDEREARVKGSFGRQAMAILIVAAISVVIYSLVSTKLDQAEELSQREQTETQAYSAIGALVGRIGEKVTKEWNKPPGSMAGLVTVISVKVKPTGEVVSALIVKSSGNVYFDQSAENAVYKASPLPFPDNPRYYEFIKEFNFKFAPERDDDSSSLSSNPMVWCATARGVERINRGDCLFQNGDWYVSKNHADREHRRLRSQAMSSTSTAGSVYCYRETPVLYYEPTTKACESGDEKITRGQYDSRTPGYGVAAATPISVISEKDKRKYRSLFKGGVVAALVMDARGQAFWIGYYSTSSGRAEDAALHRCEANSFEPLTCQIVDVNGQSTWWRSGAEGRPVAYSHASYGYCAKTYSVKRLPRDICEENLRGKFFPTKGEALAEYRRLKSLSSNSALSSSDPMVWCATAENYTSTAKGKCLAKGGKVFTTYRAAKAEHRRLKAAASASSDPMVWCATAEKYGHTTKGKCLTKGGKVFTTYTAARSEHRRLKAAASSGSSSPTPMVWCATDTRYWKTIKVACLQADGKVFSSKLAAVADIAERRRLTAAASASSDPMVWCATAENYTSTAKGKCLAKGGKVFTTYRAAKAEHRRLKAAASASSDPMVWCATAEKYGHTTKGKCLTKGGKVFTTYTAARSEHRRLKAAASSGSSSPTPMVWCATDTRYWKTIKVACLQADGKVFSSKLAAVADIAERRRLTAAASASSDPMVWCAKASGVTREYRVDCLSRAGGWYVTKEAADREHRRLKSVSSTSTVSSSSSNPIVRCRTGIYGVVMTLLRSDCDSHGGTELSTVVSSTSSPASNASAAGMVWCATNTRYWKTNKSACLQADGDVFDYESAAGAYVRGHRRLNSASFAAESDEPDMGVGGQEFVWCLKGKDLPRRTNGKTCHGLGGVSHRDLRKAVTAANFVFDATQFGKWTLDSRTPSGKYTVGTGAESDSDALFGITFFRDESCRTAWVTFGEKTTLRKPSSNVAEGVVKIGMEVTPWQGPVKVDDGWLTTTWKSDLGSFLGSLMHGYTLMIQPQKGGFRELSVRISLKGSRAAIVSALRNCLSSR